MKKTNYYGKFQLLLYLAIFTLFTTEKSFSQCDSTVPYFEVDFTGNPEGTWISPSHSRKGLCCSASGSKLCTSFMITLDTLAVAVKVEIIEGAMPSGALYYQINCGPDVMIGEEICISGVGPHFITFCKPGTNVNKYKISSIAIPTFPPDDYSRVICNREIKTFGLDYSTITLNSIYPGEAGEYNHYLSCTSACSTIYFSPDSLAPEYIDYSICGYPIADKCGFTQTLCDTFRIYILPGLSATISPSNAALCPGNSGTMISSFANGGDGNYSYSWRDSNGTIVSTSSDYFATAAGNYTLEIKDGLSEDGCNSLLITVPVTTTTPIEAEIINIEKVLCTGENNGSAAVQVTGGIGVYSYSWNTSPVQTSNTATGLSAGNYEVIINDSNECSTPLKLSVTITEPEDSLNVSLVLQENNKCKGDSIGEIAVLTTGGSGNYTYVWNTSPVQNTAHITNLTSGNYTLEVFDTNGCLTPIDITVNITEPSNSLTANIGTQLNVLCKGDLNGEATVVATGGSGNYNYEWSTSPVQFTSTVNGLSEGSYNVLVSDTNGCESKITLSVNITEPENLYVVASIEPAKCNENSGKISVNVNGGTAPYSYSWNNGSSESEIIDLTSGLYNVTVIDNNNCEQQLMISLDEISAMQLSAESENVSCNGLNNGSALINVSNGAAPYEFEWSNGATTSQLTDLSAGTYEVTIRDKDNCKTTRQITINQPEVLSVNLTASVFTNTFNISAYNGSDGAINIDPSGGAQPYSYKWSTGAITSDISNLKAGIYEVSITDANGCTTTASAVLNEPLMLEMPTGFSPNNSGKNDSFIIKGIEEFPNNNFTVFNRWGNEVYTMENYMNEWNGTNNKGEVLPTGTYFVLLIINNGDTMLKGFVDLRK